MTDEMTPVDNNTDTSQPQGDSAYVTHQSSGMTQPITWTDLDHAAPTAGSQARPLSASVESHTAPQSLGLTPAQLGESYIGQLSTILIDTSATDYRLCALFVSPDKQRPLYEYAKEVVKPGYLTEVNPQSMGAFAQRVYGCLMDSRSIINSFKNATSPFKYSQELPECTAQAFLKHFLSLYKDGIVDTQAIDAEVAIWNAELKQTIDFLNSSKVSNEEMRVFFESAAEIIRRCKDSTFLAVLYKTFTFIASRNQNIYPFAFLCAPSGSGKTALAYSLAADKYPTIYTVYSTDWARDRCQPVYQPFRLISTTMKKVINADLDVICGPSDTIERDYRKVNCEKLFNTDLMDKPLRTVHFFVQLFTDLLKTMKKGKYSTWMEAQVSIDQLLNGECSLEQGIQLLKNLKASYNIGKNDPLFVFVDECILSRDNDGNIKKAEAAEVVYMRTILRILKVFPIFAGTDARTSNFITQTAISSSYSEDCPIWALVINALPQFNVEYLAEQCKHIMEKFGQHPSICSLLKFLTTTSTYENPMLIQHALDFLSSQSVEYISTEKMRFILHRMVCSVFNRFQRRKRIFTQFSKSQFSYFLSRQWDEETLLVMEYGENSIHRHLAYLNCVPFEYGSPYFYLKLEGKDQNYLRPADLTAVNVAHNDLNVPAHNLKVVRIEDVEESSEEEVEQLINITEHLSLVNVEDDDNFVLGNIVYPASSDTASFYGARTKPSDPSNPPSSSPFLPTGILPSFSDAPLTGLTLFGVDVSRQFMDSVLEPPFQESIAGHDPAFPRISSLDAVITRCFDYNSIARGHFLETVYNAAVIMASRGNGPNGCSFSKFLVYFIKELWTVRKRDLRKGASFDYPVHKPNVLFGDQKRIFDNKTIPFLSPMPVTEWSLPTVQLMKDATDGKSRLGTFMFSTVSQKVDHIAFELNYDHVKPTNPNSQTLTVFECPTMKTYNNWVKEGILDLNLIKEISLVGECKQWNSNLTLRGIREIVDEKFQQLHKVAPIKKFLTLKDGQPNYANWCKTFIILTLSLSSEDDSVSLQEINNANYHLWHLKRHDEINYFLCSVPLQAPRSENCRDVIIISLSEVVGFNFAEKLFIYDQQDSNVSSTNRPEPPVEESKRKKIRNHNSPRIRFVPFENYFAPSYVEMLAKASQHDLDMIGSSLLSVRQVITRFNAPNRWDRLILVDGALVGEVNVSLPTGQGEVFKPQVSVFVEESARRNGYALFAIEQAIQYCRKQGHGCLYAIVEEQNSPSVALFTQCGFTRLKQWVAHDQFVFMLDL